MDGVRHVLIAGCGYVGRRLAEILAGRGHRVYALRRSAAPPPAGASAVRADLADPATLTALPDRVDAVVYAAGPASRDEAAYRKVYVDGLQNLVVALGAREQPPGRLLFTSSTGVYGQDDGSWVDEDSPAEPSGFSGRLLLEGERLAHAGPLPATVLRLGGIYGPGRTWLVDRVRSGEARLLAGPPRYTNRIHREDAAGALAHLLDLERPQPIYLGVDGHPGEHNEVIRFIASELGLAEPAPAGESAMPPGRAGNKRCRNDRLLRSGYRFRYPGFREGYRELVRGG